MGSPMAVHLQQAGHTVQGYNRSQHKLAALSEVGGIATESVAAAVRGADIVCIMVPDSTDVEAVVTGEDGVLANAAEGTLIIDFSSIRPDVARDLAERARQKGLRMLDAPVSGGEAGAKNAALSIMVGGDVDDFTD